MDFGKRLWEHPFSPLVGGLLFWGLFFLVSDSVVHAKVERLPQFHAKVSLSQIQLPPYLSVQARKELDSVVLEHSFLSPHLIPLMGQALEELPWIREVKFLKRQFPAQVSLVLQVRTPLAKTEWKGKSWVLDEKGLLIDKRYYKGEVVRQLPEVVGWKEGSHLKHAAAVLEEVMPFFRRCGLPLEKLEVVSTANGKQRPDSPLFYLHLASKTVVEWGRSPLDSFPYLSLNEKWKALEKVLGRYPQLKGVKRIRLIFATSSLVPVELSPSSSEKKQ